MQQQTTAKESCNNKHQPGTTLDPICQIMLIPVGRFCSISWRMYFLCNFLHRFGVSTHFSYTCRKGPKKRTSGPNSGQIFMRLSLKALFRITFLISFSASQCFLVPTNQSPRIFLLLHDKQQMTRQFLCQKQWFWELKWTVIGWWNQKNAIRIYAKYTQETIQWYAPASLLNLTVASVISFTGPSQEGLPFLSDHPNKLVLRETSA